MIHTLYQNAWAKLNLTLDVCRRRPDGYHDLEMVMQAISVHDDVTLTLGDDPSWTVQCTDSTGSAVAQVPQDEGNLAWKAAERFYRAVGGRPDGLHIGILKRIPSQAGLAGGSADAAAVLLALNRTLYEPLCKEALCELAAEVGSDVPFCVFGGTAFAEGRGEKLTRIPDLPTLHYVVCKPDFGLSTPQLFRAIDTFAPDIHPNHRALLRHLRAQDLSSAGPLLCNVFEPIAAAGHPEILSIKQQLLTLGACGAQMTGSGSAVFGLFSNAAEAQVAADALRGANFSVWYAHSVDAPH